MTGPVAIIPARGGSKRITGKNLRKFCGRPIIAYAIGAALDSGLFARVTVSTDSEDVARVSRAEGAEVPYLRPAALADDHATTSAVLLHALQELNSHFYRGVTPPRETVIVRVSRGTDRAVAQRYRELPPSERVNFIDHVVRNGETLSEIAYRYRVSLSFVRAANPNVRPRRMRIGQRLVIPLSQAARQVRVRSTPRVRRPVQVSPNGYHTVRAGDTLWLVSQRYGVQVKDLRDWNSIADGDTILNVGQRLRVNQ